MCTASGGAISLLVAGHRQAISHINKGSQSILIYILLLPLLTARCGSISARANTLVWAATAHGLCV